MVNSCMEEEEEKNERTMRQAAGSLIVVEKMAVSRVENNMRPFIWKVLNSFEKRKGWRSM